MTTITEFHPNIQAAIRFLTGSTLSEIANGDGITKQALQKRVQDAADYLSHYRRTELVPKTDLDKANEQSQRQANLIQHLAANSSSIRPRKGCSVSSNQKFWNSFRGSAKGPFPRWRKNRSLISSRNSKRLVAYSRISLEK